MTRHLFDVFVSSVKVIHDMPGTWFDDDYRNLLAKLEVDDVGDESGSDLFEMTLMALQDMEPEDAADVILAYKLADSISAGARHNIVQDLLEDQRPWEEAADIKLHARIFAAAVLLHKAFPSSFSRPDMMQVILHVSATVSEAGELIVNPPQAAFVARMLADALSENSILERLFDEQLQAHSFPEAEGIIWHAEFGEPLLTGNSSADLTVYSSEHWLKAMESISDFQSNAYNDTKPVEKIHDSH